MTRLRLLASPLWLILLTALCQSACSLRLPQKPEIANLATSIDRQRWALVIGISGYPKFREPLQFADKDAEAFAEFIQTPEGGSFPRSHIKLLRKNEASRERIYEAIDGLVLEVRQEDLLYVFFSGHGLMHEDRAYFMPYDGDEKNPPVMGFRADEFLKDLEHRLDPKQLVMFIDACHAGAALLPNGAHKGINENFTEGFRNVWAKTFAKLPRTRMGFFAANSDQKSSEDKELQHGLFTYYLLESLKGAAPARADGLIYSDEVRQYVDRKVDIRSRQLFRQPQTLIVSPGFNPDFPLAQRPRPLPSNALRPMAPPVMSAAHKLPLPLPSSQPDQVLKTISSGPPSLTQRQLTDPLPSPTSAYSDSVVAKQLNRFTESPETIGSEKLKTQTSTQPTIVQGAAPPSITSTIPTADNSSHMIPIPAGSFVMGSNNGSANEKPQHRVHVDAFLMDQTEVTVKSYTACVEAGRCSRPSEKGECNFGKSSRQDYPINCINWQQANSMCKFENKRLPTEKEWEYAAKSNDNRRYTWGNSVPQREYACWNRYSSCPANSYEKFASPFGIIGMSGNVLEWTADVYQSCYSQGRCIINKTQRTLRGGSWGSNKPKELQTTRRLGRQLLFGTNLTGVRCASNLENVESAESNLSE